MDYSDASFTIIQCETAHWKKIRAMQFVPAIQISEKEKYSMPVEKQTYAWYSKLQKYVEVKQIKSNKSLIFYKNNVEINANYEFSRN